MRRRQSWADLAEKHLKKKEWQVQSPKTEVSMACLKNESGPSWLAAMRRMVSDEVKKWVEIKVHNQHDIGVDQSERNGWAEAKLCRALWVIIRSLELTVVVMGNHWKALKSFPMQSNLGFKKTTLEDFPGCPVVKTPCFHCRGREIDPCSGN